MGVRLFKKFLLALVDTASKNWDQTTLSQVTPAQLMPNGEKYTGDLEWQNARGIGHGTKTKRSLGPASMNPEQRASTPTKQDQLNEEIQKFAMKTHPVAQ